MGLFSLGLLLLCCSSLINAQRIPSIDKDTYFVCEDVPPENEAFTILASDPDNDPLTYEISGEDASFFRVERSSGRVIVEKELDRETKPNMRMTAKVTEVSEAGYTRSRDIFVYLNDTNDNSPIIEHASYEDSVPEDTAVETVLFQVNASDIDSGPAGSITFTIDESVPTSGLNTFRIDSRGFVILNEPLNFTETSTFYRIRITASDRGGKCYGDEMIYRSRSVFAFIEILDLPDQDPEFIGAPYIASVKENTAIGEPVITVSAVDPDFGINDVLIYNIIDSTADGLFTIDQNGVISVNGEIDREAAGVGNSVDLTVEAKETKLNIHGVHAKVTTQVRLTILDENDNEPIFYKCIDSNCIQASSFTGQVLEHSLGAVSIFMEVKDADDKAETELSLDGDGKDIFSVQPSVAFSDSPVQLIVKNQQDLDYERIQQITLKVIAVDKGNPTLRSTADVTITIIDENDHNPVFASETYYADVPEGCPDDTTVAELTAEDPDTMDQDKITYSLQPASILQYFDVEPTTGRVYVKNGALLDRESRSSYTVTIQARDSEGKPGSAVIEVTVTDVNDEAPVPNRRIYQEFVNEGGNLENVRIEATDRDEPDTPNSQLVFSIEPGPYSENFTIDPDTGDLTNNSPLDREDIDPALEGKIDLRVNISDKGVPPLSDEVQVIINVQDVNDNKPEFGKAFYNFTVKESAKGAIVGSVYAEDRDQTPEFNRISFSITNGSFGSFMISSEAEAPGYSGRISVDQDVELDYDGPRKLFTLQVQAMDLPQEKAEVTVEVHVLDVNDETPVFLPILPVNVEENSKDTKPVGKFNAMDVDTNSSLVYELVSVKCQCGGEETLCDWFVLEPNGDVKVNQTAAIDYESCHQAIVEAQVVDKYTEVGGSKSETPGEMVINIVDVNDNAPQFIDSNSVFALVSETASKDTSVASVSATDRDSGTNADIEFKVSRVRFEFSDPSIPDDTKVIFQAITAEQKGVFVGSIQLTEALDTLLKGKFLVTVEARDTGDLTNTTELEIFVIDQKYSVTLKFELPLSEVLAQEEEIKRDLTIATKAAVKIIDIREEKPTESARATDITAMDAYFIYPNGTAIADNTLLKILSEDDNFAILSEYKLTFIGNVITDPPVDNTVMFVLFGVVAGLVIVTAVLTTSLLCTRRNYRRKLKAADAMKSVSAVMSENQKGGPVVPGTNLYTMEGANPVLNLNIDTAIALGDLGEDSDADKVSVNSLDNGYDFEKDTNQIMRKNQYNENDRDSSPPEYIEPLGAALAQRDQTIRSNNPLLGESNPIFDTTDL